MFACTCVSLFVSVSVPVCLRLCHGFNAGVRVQCKSRSRAVVVRVHRKNVYADGLTDGLTDK